MTKSNIDEGPTDLIYSNLLQVVVVTLHGAVHTGTRRVLLTIACLM